MHVEQDVGATNEFALDVDLRDRRPGGVFLDPLSQLLVLEDIKGLELGQVNAVDVEELDGGAGEATLGLIGSALHEQDEVVLLDGIIESRPEQAREEAREKERRGSQKRVCGAESAY